MARRWLYIIRTENMRVATLGHILSSREILGTDACLGEGTLDVLC